MVEGIKKTFASAAWETIQSKDSAFVQFNKSHGGRDKFIKLTAAIFKVINAILDVSPNVDPHTREGMRQTVEALDLARSMTGLLNAFGDGPGLISDSIRKIYYLILDLHPHLADSSQEAVQLRDHKRGHLQVRPEDGYTSSLQKRLGIVAEVLKLIGTIAFMAGFGLARPVQVMGKFFKNIGESARKMGSTFGIFMMITHITAIGAATIDLVRNGSYYRDFSENNYHDAKLLEEKRSNFMKVVKNNILKLISNMSELSLDVISIFKYVVPIAVTLTLALGIALIDFYQACEKAIEDAKTHRESKENKRFLRTLGVNNPGDFAMLDQKILNLQQPAIV